VDHFDELPPNEFWAYMGAPMEPNEHTVPLFEMNGNERKRIGSAVVTDAGDRYRAVISIDDEVAKSFGIDLNFIVQTDSVERERKIEITARRQEVSTEDTLRKILKALQYYGMSMSASADFISRMQNEGVLFRERNR